MSQIRLNDEQRRAVEHGSGPLLIVAGAGTGKTRVLIERVGHLLRTVKGLEPKNILALTFSRKAAAEMRQRAAERFGAAAAGAARGGVYSYWARRYSMPFRRTPKRASAPEGGRRSACAVLPDGRGRIPADVHRRPSQPANLVVQG